MALEAIPPHPAERLRLVVLTICLDQSNCHLHFFIFV